MTETEWLNGTDPSIMLSFRRGKKVSDRKLRLFASLCCGRVRSHCYGGAGLTHPAVLASEGAADGSVSNEELRVIEESIGALGSYSAIASAADVARAAVNAVPADAAEAASVCAVRYFSLTAMESIGEEAASRKVFRLAQELENIVQSAMLREIFGNPFRPVSLNPAWLTREVIDLARKALDEPQSHRVLLGEALASAGCDNTDILAHCNQIGGHTKGCWPVDLVLGKT